MCAQLDALALVRFFSGVLGWPPQLVRAARLADLSAAAQGYRQHKGLAAVAPPSRAFLDMMMQRSPDI